MDERSRSCIPCLLLPLFIGLAALAFIYITAKDNKAGYIENNLSYESNKLLAEQQIGGVTVRMQGRDATLTGTVVNQVRSDEIQQFVASVNGIRVVNNELKIVTAKLPEPEPKPEPEPTIIQESHVATKLDELSLATDIMPNEETEQAVEEVLQTLDLSGITFLFGKDEISEQGTLVLNEVSSILEQHPEFNVEVGGHTDDVGDDELNLNLSQSRAESVMDYLIQQGVSTERLTAVGYGENKPITTNDTQEGRAQNRRIEFAVTRRP